MSLYCVESIETHKLTRMAVLVRWHQRWSDYASAIFVAVDDLVIRTPPDGARTSDSDTRTEAILDDLQDN
jgi:hypothetical protein